MGPRFFKNGTIVSFDKVTESIKVLHNASLLTSDDGIITAITTQPETLVLPTDTEIIDVTDKIVCPGFVDTHRHTWMTAYRTLGSNIILAQYFSWVSQMSKARNSYSAEDIYVSALAGYAEALNGGVTSIVEHAHHNWDHDVMMRGFDAAVDSGARIWWCYDIMATNESFSGGEQTKALLDLAVRHRSTRPDSAVAFGLAWDSLSFTPPDQVEPTRAIIQSLKPEVITVHTVGPGPWGSGNSPTLAHSYALLDSPNPPWIFSHGGFVTESDRAILRSTDNFISITPESEMHYGHGQFSCCDIQDQAALGIDTAFTFSGEIFTQARIWLQAERARRYNAALKTAIPDRCPMTVEHAFLLATRHGGRAVRRDDIGVLTVGAKADIVVFDGESPNMAGWTDPVAAVILHANVSDIRHVLVGGEWRKRDGQLILKEGQWEGLARRLKEVAIRVQEENRTPPELPDNIWGNPLTTPEVVDIRRGKE
ncbi:Metallo-dependent hydrolase [Pseudovirgaria hyperparasitica]|uniref:Metallo-dependent hydrolase n=1 Tax=Pseudovirgaria hyperparasitica TaxID=470096 RepID=A0A6A6VTJ8_9PEZI|nr:Metallo-dependent hydrolase [Pseudovirgaria hyperparasitica]KAF2753475.1 Metallo-dependent hydrolase [Pseudovirgaria hyperparasitica]